MTVVSHAEDGEDAALIHGRARRTAALIVGGALVSLGFGAITVGVEASLLLAVSVAGVSGALLWWCWGQFVDRTRAARGQAARGSSPPPLASESGTAQRTPAVLTTDFLSTVTHELRTPLASVRGSLQLVLSRANGLAPIERELLEISLTNADRLIRLINEVLDATQLELGKADLASTTVESESLIAEAVAGMRGYAADREVAVLCDLDDRLPAITGDRDRLIQVLTNLIANAVKFSPTGGQVVVRATVTEEGIEIAIRDWGIGIRAADTGRLFQRYQRLNPAASDRPGTGLGLAISKAIIDRHGGRITVESREDEGSTFTVVLPRSEPGAWSRAGRSASAGAGS